MLKNNKQYEIRLLTTDDLKQITDLYTAIKRDDFTVWDADYPSDDLVRFDIARKGLYGVFDGCDLVAVCFAGQRCEDNEEGFMWRENFNKRGTFARLGVLPNYQHQGFATMLVKYVLLQLKQKDYDGVRIMVDIRNVNAINLYTKLGFFNCGEVERFDQRYYLLELRL